MALVEINWQPTDRQLRQFGAISALVLPGLAWRWGESRAVIGCTAFGVALAIVGWFWPRRLKPLFLGLTIVMMPIGMIVGELVMVAIYFAIFLPIGLVFRLSGRDSLRLKRNPNAVTYWQPKRQPTGVAGYYRQS